MEIVSMPYREKSTNFASLTLNAKCEKQNPTVCFGHLTDLRLNCFDGIQKRGVNLDESEQKVRTAYCY